MSALPLQGCMEGRPHHNRVWRCGSKESGLKTRLWSPNGGELHITMTVDGNGTPRAKIIHTDKFGHASTIMDKAL